ncbi:MAG: FAD-binding oxidoreductase [Arenicellales bacterium]|nr:FAD-binding oxidoreductase [Arenicellales bacterium]
MTKRAQVVVIGGGIVGCAAAYYLAKRGIAVNLYEKGTIAGEQSSRNWGFVRQQGRDPAELPLMMASNKIWQGLEKELNTDLKWKQGGNLRITEDESQLPSYRAWLEIAQDHGLHTKLLGAKETKQLLPGLSTSVVGALYTESDGQADPSRVAHAFATSAGKLGADVISRCAVLGVQTSAGTLSSVATEQGEVICDAVICAAGAWSSRLMSSVGLRIPQLWLRASVGYTTKGKELTHCGVWMPGVAFRQGHDGGFNIAYGGKYKHDLTLDSLKFVRDFWRCYQKYNRAIRLNLGRRFLQDLTGNLNRFPNHRTLDPAPADSVLQSALQNFKTSFPNQSDIRFDRTWAGYIDATPDMLPIIDCVDKPGGLVVATGFSGHGFGLGPIAGLLAAQLALNEPTSHDLHAFRYQRFYEGKRVEPGNVL